MNGKMSPIVRASLVVVAIAGGAQVGLLLGAPRVAIGVGAAVLVGAILLFWSSVRLLLGEDLASIALPDEAQEQAARLHDRTASDPLFERKRAALAALADMERERELGKIDATDYDEVVGPLRAQAKQVLKEIDERAAPYRERAELLAAEYLKKQGIEASEREDVEESIAETKVEDAEPSEDAAKTAEPSEDAHESTEEERAKPAAQVCAECNISNDADAKFCKGCGTSLGGADAS